MNDRILQTADNFDSHMHRQILPTDFRTERHSIRVIVTFGEPLQFQASSRDSSREFAVLKTAVPNVSVVHHRWFSGDQTPGATPA